MHRSYTSHSRIARLSFLLMLCAISLCSAVSAQTRLIHGAIQNGNRGRLLGHVHPLATDQNDLGPVDSSETLPAITLALRQTDEQKAALDALIAAQQDPASPQFHKWLTPEQYAERFGAAQSDIDKMTAWLEQQNLHVTGVARSRTWISVAGTASDVQRAFRTEIHQFSVNGRAHYANITDPSIPVAMQAAVMGIRGLHNFRMRPKARARGVVPQTASPLYTSASSGNHYLSPDDFATIYNVRSLWRAGYDGTGQTIAIAGQTRIDVADLQQFRNRFQLPANDPDTLLVPNTRDPGTITDDEGEADLDLEWAGAVAPNAKLLYVYSYDVMDAAQYIIDQNLAPVLSVSYGLCETLTLNSDALMMQSWAKQANAQGITWVNASGDSGGADCVTGTSTRNAGLAVDVPASIPEVTGIGGTTFNEGSGTFWQSTNATGGGSVLSYIPETTWNDSAPGDPAAGGGGASVMFGKPSWQVGNGVPDNHARNVPDLAMAASADHDGYMVYSTGQLQVYGGTSAGTPSFAGIIALLNQYLVSSGAQSTPGVGNANQRLYSIAQTVPSAFHDITAGDNIINITCGARSRNCVSGAYGYAAGAGYDQATGLGSVDAYNLVMAWRGESNSVSRATASLTLSTSGQTVRAGGSVLVTATVTSANGGTPTGTVSLAINGAQVASSSLSGSGSSATATFTVTGSQLRTGNNILLAQYSGDSIYPASTANTGVTLVTGTGTPSISGMANGASFQQAYAPGMILSIFGSNLADSNWSASTVPLPTQALGVTVTIGGISAPLYYASTNQLNVQIPYQVSLNQFANVVVNNNGSSATSRILVSPAAPGLFTTASGAVVPNTTARRNQVITLYITGDGAVSPTLPTGSSPSVGTPVSQLPAPVQGAAVTIGNVNALIQFMGIPPGLVGVTQINVLVGASTPTGSQPVVVSIGGVKSPSGAITITP